MARSRRPKRTQRSTASSQRQQQEEQEEQRQHLLNGDPPLAAHQERQGSTFGPLNLFFNRSRQYGSIPEAEEREGGVVFSTSPDEVIEPSNHHNLAIDMQQQQQQPFYGTSSDTSADESSRPASELEEDVCFPNDKKDDEEDVNYKELDDYVRDQRSSNQHLEAPPAPPRQRRRSSSAAAANFRRYSLYGDRNRHPQFEKQDQAADGRVTLFSVAEPQSIHVRSLDEIPLAAQQVEGVGTDTSSQLSDLLKRGCFWLDILSPTDAEMKVLSKTFHIHPLTVEDISMEEQREKCEIYKNYYFICFRSFEQNQSSVNYLQPLALYIIVLKEGVLSFHFRHTPHPHNVRKRIKQLRDYISVSPDWICYGLLDDITDSFAPMIRSIEFEVDSIDELVLILKESEQSDMLRRIGYCRKKMMSMMRLLSGKVDVVKTLVKRGDIQQQQQQQHHQYQHPNNKNEEININAFQPVLSSEVSLYLGDVQDHIITMLQSLTHYEKISSRSHSNYLAQISIEMTQTNNEMNDVLSKLTALGSILVPMNLVTGLWGMNVLVPGQDRHDLTWFMSILFAIAVFCVASTLLMRYYRLV